MTSFGFDGIIFICISISAPKGKRLSLRVLEQNTVTAAQGGIQYETRFFV